MGGVRLLVCALLLISSLTFASPSQVSGKVEKVRVPFRAEAWAGKASLPVRAVGTVSKHKHEEEAAERRRTQSEKQGANRNSSVSVSKAGPRTTTASRMAEPGSSAGINILGKVFDGPVNLNPPDPDIAAGPAHIVATVNSVVAIYDKAGTLVSQTDISSFFGSIADPGCCFDLRVLFEPTYGRFIVAAGQTDFGANSSHVYVAVSATGDPTGTWFKYSLEASNTTWSDFPTIGFSPTALYLTTDGIPFNGGGRAIWQITVVGLAELVAGKADLNVTRFLPITGPAGESVHGPVIPARTYGSPGNEYLVSTGPPGVLYLYSINTSGTPTLRSVQLNSSPFPAPGLAPQPGTSVGLGGGGDAIFTVVFRNGSLWVTQGVGEGPQPGAGALIRWYEIDPQGPAVKQLGTVAGAGAAIIPALTVRPDGQVGMVYSTSSTKKFASAAYAYRSPTDPPNTMAILGIYKEGTGAYGDPRWGDISGISADPDGKSIWGMAQYARAGGWGTSIVQLLSPPVQAGAFTVTASPPAQTVSAGQSATYSIAIAGQGSVAVTLACSGLPAGAACAFAPNPVPQAGNASTLTISTAGQTAALMPNVLLFAFLPIAGILVVTVPKRYRPFAGISLLVVVATGALAGCGGVGGSNNGKNGGGSGGTPSGSYVVTILATTGVGNATTTANLLVK